MHREIQRIGIWESMALPAEKLASDQPFCYDTLHVDQWLQWIFTPRMKAIIGNRSPLPLYCDIHPYSEENLSGYTIDAVGLLSLIMTIDDAISNNEKNHGTAKQQEFLCH